MAVIWAAAFSYGWIRPSFRSSQGQRGPKADHSGKVARWLSIFRWLRLHWTIRMWSQAMW